MKKHTNSLLGMSYVTKSIYIILPKTFCLTIKSDCFWRFYYCLILFRKLSCLLILLFSSSYTLSKLKLVRNSKDFRRNCSVENCELRVVCPSFIRRSDKYCCALVWYIWFFGALNDRIVSCIMQWLWSYSG